MTDTQLVSTALATIVGGAIAWFARAFIGARRIDRVDAVAAISKAYERVLAGHDQQLELMKELVGEQGKRIDMLQRSVSERDAVIAERDAVIRRLRDHLDTYYHALLAAGVKVDPPPDVPVAPERRSPDSVQLAAPIVEATRISDE